MNDPAPLRIALIGCGRIARTHLEAVRNIRECELAGVADVDAGAARAVAEEFGGSVFTDYRAIADDGRTEAVIICTPPATHVDIAGFCLERGLHVLCEKPLVIDPGDAETLVSLAQRHDRQLMMASKFRYVDDVIKAKGILDSGILGEIILYENVFCSAVDMRDRWNSDKRISGGGVLIDNGTHSVDIARYLLGSIAKVQAERGRRVQGLEVEDTCRLYFRTADRAMGAVDLSWSIHKERDAYIEVFGPEGVLSIGWQGSKYRQNKEADWVLFGEGYDKLVAFSSQLKNFAGSIRGTELPVITAEDSLASVRVIEAAYRSMEQDKWVPV